MNFNLNFCRQPTLYFFSNGEKMRLTSKKIRENVVGLKKFRSTEILVYSKHAKSLQ